jgi:VCBS repeat-containing protein
MATTTVSGTTVTFSNSGAAANLSQTGTEDGTLAFTFDVLAASGGGKNTTIYSVDDGVAGDDNAPVTINMAFATYDTDLLYADKKVAAWVNGRDTSALGAHVWIGTDGKIHYDATNIADEFEHLAAGETTTDTIKYTIKMSNGTLSVGTLSVVITGTNDAAVITGSSTAVLTESNAAQSTGGDLNATDVDSSSAFQAQTDVAGSKGYGTFSIDENGTWTYTMNGAQDEFVGSQDYTDSITVKTADGTEKVITVTMHGTNDAAVITGSSTAAPTESNAAQSTGGALSATDVNSSNAFGVQTNVAGDHGYGKFSIDAAGHWTYAMNDAHDEFVGGQDYTDSITVTTADGTSQVLTVTMHGTNDVPVADSDTSNDHDTDTATATTADWSETVTVPTIQSVVATAAIRCMAEEEMTR